MGECGIDCCTVYGLAKTFVSLQAKDGYQGSLKSPSNGCALVSLINSAIIWRRRDFGAKTVMNTKIEQFSCVLHGWVSESILISVTFILYSRKFS